MFSWKKITFTLSTATAVIGVFLFYKFFRRKKTLHHQIYVCSCLEDWKNIEDEFCSSCIRQKVIGLDCEWTYSNGKRQPIALMQISTAHEICVLFRLCKFKTALPFTLLQLLKNKSILKVGIDITSDRSKLFSDYGILIKGCLDLRYMIELIPEAQYIKGKSLSAISEAVLGEKLNKTREIRCSDWQNNVLSTLQIKYAAQDAIVSAQIFEKIMRWGMPKNILRLPSFKTDSDMLYEEALVICSDVIDVNYKNKSKPSSVIPQIKTALIGKYDETKGYSTRNRPFYHNCQLQAPDGEPLCVCNTKKIHWYLNKNLAVKIQDDPLIVRLNFEPAGRPILDNIYYTREKENCCVVCGKSNSFIKKNVVPHEYRKYFPNLMKDHLSHDVLLLCVGCHKRSNAHDLALRRQLVKECEAPLGSQDNIRLQTDPVRVKVHSAAKALARSKSIPKNRKTELENLVKNFYQVDVITPEILEEGANMNTKVENENYISHGQKVVQHISQNGGLIAFETRWRKHFLDTMNPQYLPQMWSVDHNHERLLLQIKNGNVDLDLSILGLSQDDIHDIETGV